MSAPDILADPTPDTANSVYVTGGLGASIVSGVLVWIPDGNMRNSFIYLAPFASLIAAKLVDYLINKISDWSRDFEVSRSSKKAHKFADKVIADVNSTDHARALAHSLKQSTVTNNLISNFNDLNRAMRLPLITENDLNVVNLPVNSNPPLRPPP